MEKIIVSVDFSEASINAFRFALPIAEKMKATVILVHVVKISSTPFTYFSDKNLEQKQAIAQLAIDEMKKKYTGASSVAIESKVLVGNVFNEISNLAKYNDASLIIIGSHGTSGFEELWLGSTAFKIINYSSCPVLSIRQNFLPRKIKTIVLPIDYTPETRQKVPFIAEFAKTIGADVHVLDICEKGCLDKLSNIEHFKEQVIQYLISHDVQVISNSARGTNLTNMTIEYAQSVNSDLIAIMTEQNEKTKNIWLGPYAQQMVNHSPIPVLSIHPF